LNGLKKNANSQNIVAVFIRSQYILFLLHSILYCCLWSL